VGEFIRLTAATILGALISFGTTFFFERRKEQRTEQAERHQDERQLRQALRLVWEELIDTSCELDAAVENGHWWSDPPHDLKTQRWDTYGPILAALIDEGSWSGLTYAYATISDFNVSLAMARNGKEIADTITGANRGAIDGSVMSEAWRESINRAHTTIWWGIETLRPLAENKS
jgi:hypothetical protein